MRSSPPVVVHVQPQWAVQALVALVVALAASGLAAWVISYEWRAWPVALAVPLLAAHAWREAAVSPRRLRWDGEAWWMSTASLQEEVRVSVAVVIDLDAWLLLKLSPGPCWLPLARAQQMQWGALRATLFAAHEGAGRRGSNATRDDRSGSSRGR